MICFFKMSILLIGMTKEEGSSFNENKQKWEVFKCDNIQINASSTTVCLGYPVTLTGTSVNGGTITWDQGIVNGSPFMLDASGTYTFTASSTHPNDCSNTITITVLNYLDSNCDFDGDGILNGDDLDDDNDGIVDEDECNLVSFKHIIVVIDESGSIAGSEITDVKAGLTNFINSQIGTGNTVSFVGMSHSNDNTRADHVVGVHFPLNGTDNTSNFDVWISEYRSGRVSNLSDYWASALGYVANSIPLNVGDELIILTDGAQGSKTICATHASAIEDAGVHLFAIGIDTNTYFGIPNSNVEQAINGIYDNVAGSTGNPIQEISTFSNIDYYNSEYDRVFGFVGLGNSLLAAGNVTVDVCDVDGDGLINAYDLDSDNDGISDLVESGADYKNLDTDKNGMVDGNQFLDGNQNGLADIIETKNGVNNGTVLIDTDSDFINNVIDLDSDNDGIPDAIEAQPTLDYNFYFNYSGTNDNDADGVLSIFDTYDGLGGTFTFPQDTDTDGIIDALDSDSDEDGIWDFLESGLTMNGFDNDNNGIDDDTTINASYSDPNGEINNPSLYLFNEKGDTSEVAYRESCHETASTGTPVLGKSVHISTFDPAQSKDWINNSSNGILVLGSKTKGFVITRMDSPETAIGNPVEGMIVFDSDEQVIKLFDGDKWVVLTQKCL